MGRKDLDKESCLIVIDLLGFFFFAFPKADYILLGKLR